MKRQIMLILGLVAILPTSAFAQFSEKDVTSGKVGNIDGGAVIFLHGTGRQGGTFIRVPDAEDIAAYRTARKTAFAEAVKRYQKQHKRWESDVKIAKQTKSKLPQEPVEPTDGNFSIGPIEQRTAIHFGPDYAYFKDRVNDRFSYLVSVKPGTYIWYGPIIYDPKQGFIGVCHCMGSVKFEVKAGVVTNLGNFLTAAPLAEKQKGAPFLDIKHSGGWNGFKVELPAASSPVDFTVPASLAKWPSATPQFSASGKLNNFYGVMITRLPPIPDILAYERDQVIDVHSGKNVTAGY
jgi:hypothetical protein